MQLWTLEELRYLTRDELCRLADDIERALVGIEAGTVERLKALTSLTNIRRTMLIRRLTY